MQSGGRLLQRIGKIRESTLVPAASSELSKHCARDMNHVSDLRLCPSRPTGLLCQLVFLPQQQSSAGAGLSTS